eukprot:3602184-Rhodomonas_salina.3
MEVLDSDIPGLSAWKHARLSLLATFSLLPLSAPPGLPRRATRHSVPGHGPAREAAELRWGSPYQYQVTGRPGKLLSFAGAHPTSTSPAFTSAGISLVPGNACFVSTTGHRRAPFADPMSTGRLRRRLCAAPRFRRADQVP